MYKYTKIQEIPEKLHHCQRSKKLFTWHVISIIALNKSHAHHRIHLYTMKVYNTRPSQFLLIKILLFFDHSVVFTCSKVIDAFAFSLPPPPPLFAPATQATYKAGGANIKSEMVLSPNDEEVANSSKKHT